MVNASSQFWLGKKVLITGHTGFKGSWLTLWLYMMGAKVTGISLLPKKSPNLFDLIKDSQMSINHFFDISDKELTSNLVKKIEPDIVFHLAAQALVRTSYKDPLETITTNVIGTTNILDSIRGLDSVKAVVFVTTDKVYKNNLGVEKGYREDDHLGGFDPYSASKAASEIIISSFRDSYLYEQGVGVASARAGNVIGGGDWSEDRLIPDAVRAWESNKPLIVRKPEAVRPWQHVLEPLNGYLVLAEKIYLDKSLSGAYNFGPENNEAASVRKIIETANKIYGAGIIKWGDETHSPHEADYLTLDTSKIKLVLGIIPRWNVIQSIKHTMKWYLKINKGFKAQSLCEADISEFTGA